MPTKTTIKTTATATFSYEENGIIDQALRKQLEASAASIFDLGRRTTEQTFELGHHLAQAADLLADGRFDKWVKMRCGLAARSARNYMAVFRNLGQFRDELVDLTVGATALFHLSSATEEQIKAALTFAEENNRLQVADVKAIVAGGKDRENKSGEGDQFDVGGIGGLKGLIAIKIRDGLKAFIAHIATICQAIEAALAKSRVIKEGLAKEIQDIARVALQELESLALFIESDLDWGRNPRLTKFPKASGWAEVNDTLFTLGGVDGWPKSKDMRDWLALHVLPVLGWAVSREKMPEWPLATADAGLPKQEVLVDAEAAADQQVAIEGTPKDAADATSVREARIDRFGKALSAATGGFMTASGDVPLSRKQVTDVPPVADESIAEVEPAHAVVR